MAKRNAKAAARRREAEKNADQLRFDDAKYGRPLFSATFDYNELSFSRAANMLAPRVEPVAKLASVVPLLGIVFSALAFKDNNPLLYVCFVVAMVFLVVSSNWSQVLQGYARRTTLAPAPGGERRHVVVTDDAVHMENEQGALGSYDLSDLRVVHRNDECVVAGFGARRYAYVPRSALSEGRFRELGRFLEERRKA